MDFNFKIDHINVLIQTDREIEDWEKEKGLDKEISCSVKSLINDNTTLNIGQFSFSTLPGCCGVVVCYYTVKSRDLIGNTFYGNLFRKIKEKFAYDLGYTKMICTVNMSQIPAVKNLFKSNYKVCSTFKNKRTGNLIALAEKSL